jgi:pantothenate kinase type III
MRGERQTLKTRRNAERLIGYLREQDQPVSIARIVIAGVMSSHDASDAIQYGVRHGAIERIKRRGARANDRVHYRLTGHPLPAPRKGVAAPSFDALLTAWGVAHIANELG